MIAHPVAAKWADSAEFAVGRDCRAVRCCQCCQFRPGPAVGGAALVVGRLLCRHGGAAAARHVRVPSACPRADAPRVGAVDGVLVHAGAGVQRPGLVAGRLAARGAVSHRLPDRMVVVDGQRVRVRGDLHVLRRAAEVSVSRAVLGHPRRDRDAADVHPRGGQAARAVRMGDVHLRRVPGLHGLSSWPGRTAARRTRIRTSCCGSPASICRSRRARTATSSSSGRTASCSSRRCFWCCW